MRTYECIRNQLQQALQFLRKELPTVRNEHLNSCLTAYVDKVEADRSAMAFVLRSKEESLIGATIALAESLKRRQALIQRVAEHLEAINAQQSHIYALNSQIDRLKADLERTRKVGLARIESIRCRVGADKVCPPHNWRYLTVGAECIACGEIVPF